MGQPAPKLILLNYMDLFSLNGRLSPHEDNASTSGGRTEWPTNKRCHDFICQLRHYAQTTRCGGQFAEKEITTRASIWQANIRFSIPMSLSYSLSLCAPSMTMVGHCAEMVITFIAIVWIFFLASSICFCPPHHDSHSHSLCNRRRKLKFYYGSHPQLRQFFSFLFVHCDRTNCHVHYNNSMLLSTPFSFHVKCINKIMIFCIDFLQNRNGECLLEFCSSINQLHS